MGPWLSSPPHHSLLSLLNHHRYLSNATTTTTFTLSASSSELRNENWAAVSGFTSLTLSSLSQGHTLGLLIGQLSIVCWQKRSWGWVKASARATWGSKQWDVLGCWVWESSWGCFLLAVVSLSCSSGWVSENIGWRCRNWGAEETVAFPGASDDYLVGYVLMSLFCLSVGLFCLNLLDRQIRNSNSQIYRKIGT